MSAKWQRVRAADDELFRGPWLWPIKALLRTFSSITLAVILLTSVAVYGTLASVPIGLLALAPTYVVIGLTILAVVVPVAGLPLFVIHRRTGGGWRSNPAMFAGLFLLTLVLARGTHQRCCSSSKRRPGCCIAVAPTSSCVLSPLGWPPAAAASAPPRPRAP